VNALATTARRIATLLWEGDNRRPPIAPGLTYRIVSTMILKNGWSNAVRVGGRNYSSALMVRVGVLRS